MDYSAEQISRIEEYAGYLMRITEIASLLDISPDLLKADISDKTTDVSRAYRRGKAKTMLVLRKQELDLAKVGSPLAVQLTAGYLMDMNDDEDY